MGISDVVAPQLPYLRRFSRALTGSQASGDAYVEALLETLVSRSGQPQDRSNPTRASASMACFAACGSRSASTSRIVSHGRNGSGRRSSSSPISHRVRARLSCLTAVEGFSLEDAAKILATDQAGIAALLDEASREIGEMMATDVLIIEDEPLIAMDIEDIVVRLGHRVTGIARTRKEAVSSPRPTGPASSSPISSSPTAARGSMPSTISSSDRGPRHLHHRLSRSGFSPGNAPSPPS